MGICFVSSANMDARPSFEHALQSFGLLSAPSLGRDGRVISISVEVLAWGCGFVIRELGCSPLCCVVLCLCFYF